MASVHPSRKHSPHVPAAEERDPLLGASTSARSPETDETNESLNARRGYLARASTFPLLQILALMSGFALILYYNDGAFNWFDKHARPLYLAWWISLLLILVAGCTREALIIGVLSFPFTILTIIVGGLSTAKHIYSLQATLMAVILLLALFIYTLQTRFSIVSPVAFVFSATVISASAAIVNLFLPFANWLSLIYPGLVCLTVIILFTVPAYIMTRMSGH